MQHTLAYLIMLERVLVAHIVTLVQFMAKTPYRCYCVDQAEWIDGEEDESKF